MIQEITVTDWAGCYPSQWQGKIHPEAFAHPAKFSSRLIENIYRHMVDMGWLHEGDKIIDPFGGVGLGALEALRYGMDWTGCELEPRFVELGNANIQLWNSRYAGKLPKWGNARLLQGDSRYLSAVVRGARAAVSSPPFSEPGSQPPNIRGTKPVRSRWADEPDRQDNYGFTPGNLGNMSMGDFAAALSSPPFLQATGGTNVTAKNGPLSDPALIKRHSAGNQAANAYGTTPGQLSELQPGDWQAAVSSPPFENSLQSQDAEFENQRQAGRGRNINGAGHLASLEVYGSTAGQLGQDHGATFWEAARAIIEQTYAVLAPGGHAVWVCKGYIKGGKLVDFPAQWRQVCESVGFETLHEHHAMLVKHNGTSRTLEGDLIEHVTSSKSFFRRLSEKRGSPPIDFETVYCMAKP